MSRYVAVALLGLAAAAYGGGQLAVAPGSSGSLGDQGGGDDGNGDHGDHGDPAAGLGVGLEAGLEAALAVALVAALAAVLEVDLVDSSLGVGLGNKVGAPWKAGPSAVDRGSSEAAQHCLEGVRREVQLGATWIVSDQEPCGAVVLAPRAQGRSVATWHCWGILKLHEIH